MSRFTVLGARGLIGSHLAAALARAGHEVIAPPRDRDLAGQPLGHVIYAIGITADFRTRPFDTIAAHVCRLNEILRDCQFESLLYLSSTRVYQGLVGRADETTELQANPQRPGDLYNLSKLAGEALCLASGRPTRIVRISNVYHPGDRSDNFLPSVIRSALAAGHVTFDAAPESAKDFVALADVVEILPKIACAGRERVYNLSSGRNVSYAELAERLSTVVPCTISYAANAAACAFPQISNERIRGEFGFRPASLIDDLPACVDGHRAPQEACRC